MSNSPRRIEPSDINIKEILLSNPRLDASVQIMDQVEGIDIWEDMEKPTLYATIVIRDGVDLLNTFPIIGEEEVIFSFETPGQQTITFNFRVFEVAGIAKNQTGKEMVYTLRCVSKEHLFNGSSIVQTSYNDVFSSIVPIILKEFLNTSKQIFVDETKGIQKIAVPRLTPLEFIDLCRQRAVSKQYPSSSFVFFENQQGFYFKTVESFIKQNRMSSNIKVFNVNQGSLVDEQGPAEASMFRTIIGYENIARADSIEKITSGMFRAVTKTFDITTKRIQNDEFRLEDIFSKLNVQDKGINLPNTNDFIKNFTTKTPTQFFMPKSSIQPDNFFNTAIAAKNSFAYLLNGNLTRVKVHGDFSLKIGDLVNLRLPETTGLTGAIEEDDIMSGNYLIIRLRHMIFGGAVPKHQIVFDCVRMGI